LERQSIDNVKRYIVFYVKCSNTKGDLKMNNEISTVLRSCFMASLFLMPLFVAAFAGYVVN
jgi:hypothetical protein